MPGHALSRFRRSPRPALLLGLLSGMAALAAGEAAGGPLQPFVDARPINPPPSTLTVTSRTESLVTVRFTCGANADVHELWRRREGERSFSRTAPAQCLSSLGLGGLASDTRGQPETPYCYVVRAANAYYQAWSAAPFPRTTSGSRPTPWRRGPNCSRSAATSRRSTAWCGRPWPPRSSRELPIRSSAPPSAGTPSTPRARAAEPVTTE
jgi:hypothetical protein